MKIDRLFVYGTLRPRGRAFDLVAPVVRRHEPAVLTGYGLVGEGHRYPWCVEWHDQEVAGDLLWLRKVDATLALLDEYEGIHGAHAEYSRVVLDVTTATGLLPAWVYIGGPGVPGDARPIDGGDWLV